MTESSSMIVAINKDLSRLRNLERVLLQNNYRVVAVDQSDHAVVVIRETVPDLVIVDAAVDQADLEKICAELNENPAIPVIFMGTSGRAAIPHVDTDSVDYLPKPVQNDVLLSRVQLILRRAPKQITLRPTRNRVTQASEFEQFRRYLIDQLNLQSEAQAAVGKVTPSTVYDLASDLGISEERLAQLIAEFLHLSYVGQVPSDIIQFGRLPRPFSEHHKVVAVRDSAGKNCFLLSNPFNWELVDLLEQFNDVPGAPSLMITDPGNILLLLRGEVANRIRNPIKTAILEEKPRAKSSFFGGEAVARPMQRVDFEPVSEVYDMVLREAVARRASDIHMEPKENHTVLRFRIDGDMRDMFTISKDMGMMLISRLKVLGGLDIAEKRRPQDGACSAVIDNRTFQLRLASSGTPNGETLVVRMLEPNAKPKKLGELGMTEQQTRHMIRFAQQNQGLVLIVGPTGSGKTTTIYSLLSQVDCATRSLMSVEDPVEYRIPLANQQEVNEKAGINFESLLRSVVRQDPDILFLGEIRDGFSAKIAVDLASTGHLTVSTLHTSNATTAVFRLERLGVARETMADSILGITAQRLLKRLCPYCKEVGPITPEEEALLKPFTEQIPSHVARPVGCDKCNDLGYLGREGVYEVWPFDRHIADLVRSGTPISNMRLGARQRGEYLISDHVIDKVHNLLFSVQDAYSKVLIEEAAIFTRAQVAVEASSEPHSIESPEAVEEPSVLRKGSVLVVDDDEDTRSLIRLLLDNQGYDVTLAQDGVEALLQVSGRDFDLIVSDINMPNFDGFKLVEMLKDRDNVTPIIFLTARTDEESQARARQLGVSDYVHKPLQKDDLLSRVRNILEKNVQHSA